MNELSLIRCINEFKRRNNISSENEVIDNDVCFNLIKDNVEKDKYNIVYGKITSEINFINVKTNLPTVIQNGKYDKCHYVVIDLSKVKDSEAFSNVILELIKMSEESKNSNYFYIGFKAKEKYANHGDDGGYLLIQDLIRETKQQENVS